MGVKGLWDILSELCERKPLTYLTGKKVAVDLSGWVVQALQCQGLNKARNPHLRNLFFRVSRLLELGVFPIFVTEGKPPVLKEDAIKSRNADRHGGSNSSSISRSNFDRILKQCENLLHTLGVPCVKSSGEAEAFCAFLCLKGVVSGVITEDNDAFLYGADVIYKDFSVEPNDSHVNVYCLKSEKNKYNLDRRKLVALALLLGCDYSKGVPGIGKETAIKLLNELNCGDILQRFKDWKDLSECELFPGLESQPLKKGAHCTRCGHLGSSSKHKKDGCSACDSEITCYLPDPSKPCRCPWHKNDELLKIWKTELKIYKSAKNCTDFPDMKVVDEYLNFNDIIPSDDILDWTCPQLMDFQEIILNMLGWTFQHSFEKILPLITSWQQYKLLTNNCDKSDFFCEPIELLRTLAKSLAAKYCVYRTILKERSLRGDSYFEVKWKLINKNCDLTVASENLVTTEYGDRFSAAYKNLVDEFFQELKAQKEAKKQTKKMKIAKDCRKVKSKSPEKYSETHDSQELSHKKNLSCTPPLSSQDAFDIPNSMEITPVKESSYNDSFNGLLDVPLFERIKIMPKALLRSYETSLSRPPGNANDLVNILFGNSLNDSNFSPICGSTLNIEKKKNEISFKSGEMLNLSGNTNNTDQIVKVVCNDSLCSSDGLPSCRNYNNILDTKKELKEESMDLSVDEAKKSIPKQETDIVDVVNPENLKKAIYLDFSDSDDSFLSLLSQEQKYHEDIVNSPEYINVEKDIASKCSLSIEFNANSEKQNILGFNNTQNVSTPLMKKSYLSPSILYSLKHSISRTQKKIFPRYLLSEIFNISSPKSESQIFAKNSLNGTPNSTKFTNLLYSPLMFDSSIDEL